MTTPRRCILIVDDDPDARLLASEALQEHGFDVVEAADGEAALHLISCRAPDLVVLDLGLPGIGGLDLLKWLRDRGTLPVILLTGRSGQADRVVGLELGADDYIVKPFDPREMVARVNAVLRRGQSAPPSARLDYGELTIDLATRDVRCRGELIELKAREFDLLAFMAASPRRVFSREQLLEGVWESSSDWQDSSTVNEHVHRLRRKLETDSSEPQWIETVRGAGYRFLP